MEFWNILCLDFKKHRAYGDVNQSYKEARKQIIHDELWLRLGIRVGEVRDGGRGV